MIDWHSERFKKFAVWLMAVLAVLFLVTGLSSRGDEFFALFPKIGKFLGIVSSSSDFKVKVFGKEVNTDEYESFVERWRGAVSAESNDYVYRFMMVYGPYGLTSADAYQAYFQRAFPYMPSRPLMEGIRDNRLDKVLAEYMDNFYCRCKEAEKMGMLVSDKRVDELVQTNPMFMSTDPLGQQRAFNPVRFATWLSQSGLTEPTYRQFLKERLMIEQVDEMYVGRFLPGTLPVSPLKIAEEYRQSAEQRRVEYFKAGILSYMDAAQAEAAKRGEDKPDDKTLEEYYNNSPKYVPGRKVSGDYLYIDLAKLTAEMEAKGVVNRSEIEPDIQLKMARVSYAEMDDFYNKNKDKLYRKPVEPTPPAPEPAPTEPPAGTGNPIADNTTPPAAEPSPAPPAAEPASAQPTAPAESPKPAETAPAPPAEEQETQYLPADYVKIKDDMIKQGIEDEARLKSLDELYKQLEDCLKDADSIKTRDIAGAVFKDVSMGNFLEKLGGFFKASLAEARKREGAADLKVFADRYPGIVEYVPAVGPFSKDDADKVPRIGGKDLARVPEDLFVRDVKHYHFAKREFTPYADRKICAGEISGFLTPSDENFRFVIRVLEAEEGQRPAFATLTEEKKNDVKKDCFEEKVKEEAYRQLYVHMQADEMAIAGNSIFDFDKDARNLEADEVKYRNEHLAEGEKPIESIPDFVKPSPYFDQSTPTIKDISDDDRTAFIKAAFDLPADGSKSAVVARIADPKDMPKTIDTATVFYYVLKLAEDKPILYPSLEQFDKNKMELFQRAIGEIRSGEDIRQDRFDMVKANFSKTGEEQKELQKRKRQSQ